MDDLKVTLLQSGLHWENIDANIDMFNKKIAEVRNTDLIVLPEMFNTGFSMVVKKLAEKPEGRSMQWMASKAKEKNCIITGSLIIEENGKYYNRLIWMPPDGSYKKYDKRHLFRMAGEDKSFSAGFEKLIVKLNGWKLCPLVCYDLRFPVWSRNKIKSAAGSNQLAEEYDVLIYIANWPERRNHAWKTLLQARAIENQCYVIGLNRVGKDGNEINYTGDSAVVNPLGEIISSIKAGEESIQTITLSKKELDEFRKAFPVAMDADQFEIKI